MILLDTNVISELMRPKCEPKVMAWLDNQAETSVWTSAITVAEIRLGIALLPEGKRKSKLSDLAEAMFQEEFSDRCLPFDYSVSTKYASIVSTRTQRGRPISVEDAQIAAIACTAGHTLATRNIKDFVDIDELVLMNPWID